VTKRTKGEGQMLEKNIELKLVMEVKKKNGLALKLVCPGFYGMPDRIVLLQGGKIGFVEVKAPGKKPRALQLARHKQLRKLGFKVFVLDDAGKIGEVLNAINN
jgi:hypothetical protein